jgi:cytochrome c
MTGPGTSPWRGSKGQRPLVLFLSIFLALLSGQASAQAPPNRAEAQAQRRAATGNLVGHGGPVKAIAVSADGTRALTGSFDYSAILWDLTVEPPKQLLRLADHNGAINAVAFVNGTTRALTAGDDSIVRLWDLATGKLIHKFEGHDPGSKIVSLSISWSGDLAVSAGWDRTARVWDLAKLSPGPVLRDHKGPVNAAVFGAEDWLRFDGPREKPLRVFTASYDGDIRVFNGESGDVLRRIYSAGQSVNVLMRLRAGDRLSRGTESVVLTIPELDYLSFGTVSGQSGIIDATTGVVRLFPETDRPILAQADVTVRRSATGPAAGHVIMGSGDGKIRVISYETGAIVQEYKSAFGPVWALAARRPSVTGDATALYYGGLDDFVTYWPFAPRAPFEAVDASQYPRRFQQQAAASDDGIAKGEIQFARKCSICHTLTPDGANRAGPTLHNVFGRRIATLPGYNYSPELKTLDIVWNAETIAKLFELGPDKFTPGSKMPLQVMSDKAERDALIAFLAEATK